MPTPEKTEYFQGEHIHPDLLDAKAEEVARQLLELKPAQLRRFFGQVMTLRRRVQLDNKGPDKGFASVQPEFKMLRAKAAYARGRKHIPDAFLRFFVTHTHNATGHREFEAFCKHFEAVVGFHGFYCKER